jgi:hypothetical protein
VRLADDLIEPRRAQSLGQGNDEGRGHGGRIVRLVVLAPRRQAIPCFPVRALPVINLLLPGTGLIVGGRLPMGVPLLVLAVIVLSLALGILGLFSWSAALPLVGVLLIAYAGLALIAGGLDWWCRRRSRIDPVRVRALHREACVAFLTGAADALPRARALIAAAPEESGAWRFLALVARERGEAAVAAKAESRADALDQR